MALLVVAFLGMGVYWECPSGGVISGGSGGGGPTPTPDPTAWWWNLWTVGETTTQLATVQVCDLDTGCALFAYNWKGYARIGSSPADNDARSRYVYALNGGWAIKNPQMYDFHFAISGFFVFRSDRANYGRLQWTGIPLTAQPLTEWWWHYADASLANQPNVPAGYGPYWLPWAEFDLLVTVDLSEGTCWTGCRNVWQLR
ncbi:MAG TPA: hypothetical protein VNN12_09780 [Dehalococcoidia bacterium]|nr:hypothetical protein [Dehalococcoidia bacterium]